MIFSTNLGKFRITCKSFVTSGPYGTVILLVQSITVVFVSLLTVSAEGLGHSCPVSLAQVTRGGATPSSVLGLILLLSCLCSSGIVGSGAGHSCRVGSDIGAGAIYCRMRPSCRGFDAWGDILMSVVIVPRGSFGTGSQPGPAGDLASRTGGRNENDPDDGDKSSADSRSALPPRRHE